MKVHDILRVKGNTLYTVHPDELLRNAVALMAEKDLGSLVVMHEGRLVGMLTFREVMRSLMNNDGTMGDTWVGQAMNTAPQTCTPTTDVDDVRRMMLTSRARYMPVMNWQVLEGVISFFDVARAVEEEQVFENTMLKAYIRGSPYVENPKLA